MIKIMGGEVGVSVEEALHKPRKRPLQLTKSRAKSAIGVPRLWMLQHSTTGAAITKESTAPPLTSHTLFQLPDPSRSLGAKGSTAQVLSMMNL